MNYQDETEFQQLLARFKKLSPRCRVLEIGSLHGETLRHWIENMEVDGLIVSVDLMIPPADPRYLQQKLGHEILWHQWAMASGHSLYVLDRDSRDPLCVKIVSSLLPVIDFLWIDGGHDRDTCLRDWTNYSPLVRPGGLVAFHDLGREWPDVRPVWESVKTQYAHEEFVASPDRYGIGVLEMSR